MYDDNNDAFSDKPTYCPRFVGAIAGVGSGLTKVAVGHGFDTVKIRLQCSPPGTYRGAVDCFLKTLHNESILGLYKGVLPPAIGQAAVDSVLLGSLHNYRLYLLRSGMTETTPGAEDTRRLTLVAHGIAGLFAGLTSSVLATPMEQIKVKLQLQLQRSVSQRQFKGALHCAFEIVRRKGFPGLWHGFVGSLAFRSNYAWMFVSIEAFMRGFSSLKDTSYEMNTGLCNFLSGGLASLIFWTLAIPADNIKNRMYASPLDAYQRPTFMSILRCIITTSGPLGFFNGLAPTLMRAFPVNASAYFVWEALMAASSEKTW